LFLGGLKLSPIVSVTQTQYRLSSDTIGILISDVEPKSKAVKAGFEAGDVIIQIEDVEIKNFVNLVNAIKKKENINKR
ncbi:PDZ domain-containing protein, partial [Aliarcobacter butzleri]|uniref:PDZ domain-containing protein n=1 Tax=Aliarcobacter butzleri TaxID=28197 RepID=UPI003AF8CAA0